MLRSQGAELESGTGIEGARQRMILAATLLAAGDRDGYRAACAEAAAGRRNTTEATQAERIAKTCRLAPDSGMDAASLATFVAIAQSHKTHIWLQLLNALSEYRLGRWNTAADWLALQEKLRGVRRASAGADTPYLRMLRKHLGK